MKLWVFPLTLVIGMSLFAPGAEAKSRTPKSRHTTTYRPPAARKAKKFKPAKVKKAKRSSQAPKAKSRRAPKTPRVI